MVVNYLAVFVCAVLSMILGFLWYGPIFGRKWLEAIGMDPAIMDDKEKCKEMGKGMSKLYFIQFVLSILQSFAIVLFYQGGGPQSIKLLVFIWLGFVVPVLGSSSVWGETSKKRAWLKFGIQAGYQLVFILVASLALSFWR